MSIPDIAAQIVIKDTLESNEDSRTIIVVGSKSVGKSNVIHTFLEKSDTTRETLVLEYSFGRKTSAKQNLEKTICHVWEYGGRLEMLKNVLESIPINRKCCFCIMVDLSKIKTIWNTVEVCIQVAKELFSDSLNSPELVIVGGKYDIFKNYDNDTKKFICTSLRSVALLHDANLLFYSLKEPQLARKVKDFFHIIGFGNGTPIKEKNTNCTKPLIIPKGSDSWDSIGTPVSTIEQVKVRHLSRIAPEIEVKQEIKTLQKSHPEPTLDSLVALKLKEIRNMELFDSSIDNYMTSLL